MSVKSALQDFHEKPNLVKAWIRAGLKWWDSHPNANSHKKFTDIYEVFVHNYFYRSYEDFDAEVGSLNTYDLQVVAVEAFEELIKEKYIVVK